MKFSSLKEKAKLCMFFSVAMLATPAMAAGGLDEATNAIETFKGWLYGFMGVFALVYMLYHIILAMLEKEQWSDVLMAVGKVAAAGGSLLLAEWAWTIWGS